MRTKSLKILAIEEANDISTIKPEELIGNLMSYEVNMQAKWDQAQDKKNSAFQAEQEDDVLGSFGTCRLRDSVRDL